MRSLWFCLLLWGVLPTTLLAVGLNNQAPFVPLYSSNNTVYNDNFYTVDPQQLQLAIQTHGYTDSGVSAYLERRQQPNTRAFKRFYKGPPQTDHFYTADAAEEALVLSYGWEFERIEGYIYTTAVPGAVPFYRVNKWNPQNSDLVHKYTVDIYEVQQLQAQGWGYDGIAGYVYSDAFPQLSKGWIAGLRCPTASPDCWVGVKPVNYRDFYFPHVLVPSTFRPYGRTRQQMSFNFWSPNFFSDTGHLAFGLHGNLNVGQPDLDVLCPNGVTQPWCTWHRGLGAIITGTEVKSEAWWSMANSVQPANYSTGPLQNNRQYRMVITVTDAGVLNYTVTDTLLNSVVSSTTWNTASVYPGYSPFPTALNGYFLVQANDNQRDFTFYVTNLSVAWLP